MQWFTLKVLFSDLRSQHMKLLAAVQRFLTPNELIFNILI